MLQVQNNKNKAPEYLNYLIPKRMQNFVSRSIYIPSYSFEQSILFVLYTRIFLPPLLDEWLYLNPSIINSKTINALKQKLLPFFRV